MLLAPSEGGPGSIWMRSFLGYPACGTNKPTMDSLELSSKVSIGERSRRSAQCPMTMRR